MHLKGPVGVGRELHIHREMVVSSDHICQRCAQARISISRKLKRRSSYCSPYGSVVIQLLGRIESKYHPTVTYHNGCITHPDKSSLNKFLLKNTSVSLFIGQSPSIEQLAIYACMFFFARVTSMGANRINTSVVRYWLSLHRKEQGSHQTLSCL